MSSEEPLSPTSPIDYSPISPIRARLFTSFPTTPVIEPLSCLPRLVTSFQEAYSIREGSRIASLQFQLSTPSPLSLDQRSATSAQLSSSMEWQNAAVEKAYTLRSSLTTYDKLTLGQAPNDGTKPWSTPLAPKDMPSLLRQNANEGFGKLESEAVLSVPQIMVEKVHPPHRLNAPSSRPGEEVLAEMVQMTSGQKGNQCSDISSSICDHGAILMTPRPRSRSPISKHRNQHKTTRRRRITCSAHSTATTNLTDRPPISPQTQARQKEIKARITHLSRPLVPLVSVTTGVPHPDFPKSLLQYQLLTHEQLNGLAQWYHQTGDAGQERWMYPCPIGRGKIWSCTGQETDAVVDLQTKRRRWGRFIGLRDCESPVENQGGSVDDLEARMEREWMDAMKRAREADKARDKMGRRWF